VTLEPNKHFGKPFLYDASGINLTTEGEDFRTFRVKEVVANSPAAETGIQPGDLIQEIDGHSAGEYTLEQLRQMLKEAGKTIEFVLKRNDETLGKKIVTRRLI
jgi:C-terminal processing protease CtpA/Prc